MKAAATPLFTVLLPVHRPPDLLPFALDSVLAQSVGDFELKLILDGAPPETLACARDYAARDPRIEVRAHPKGGWRGERWRHEALLAAQGRYVCQLGDDDLWLPDHLAEMAELLAEVDFGHTLHVETYPDGRVRPNVGNLAIGRTREQLLTQAVNLTGPTCAGYRLGAYRALPDGWTAAPAGIWSDLHMWRKFLRHPGLSFGTRYAVTAVCLPNAGRLELSRAERIAENRRYAALIQDPAWRADYRARALETAARTLSHWLEQAHAQLAARPTIEEMVALRSARERAETDAARLADLARRLERRLGDREARLAYVERSRLWRLRVRLARLFGRD